MSDLTTTSGSEYVAAFFDSGADAEAAVARIVAEGVPREQVRVVPGASAGGADRVSAEPRQRGFFEALADMFMPEDDRYAYAEGLSRGGVLVSLYTTAENCDRILDILDDEGTVDMDAREQTWRAEGWQGYPANQAATSVEMTGAAAATRESVPTSETNGDEKIDVVEEQLRVGKRQVDQGRVRVRSYVVETPVEEQVSLRGETVHLAHAR